MFCPAVRRGLNGSRLRKENPRSMLLALWRGQTHRRSEEKTWLSYAPARNLTREFAMGKFRLFC
jgi:hypothetical protein